MDQEQSDRLEQLAGRVRWLDRNRRKLSLLIAAVFCVLLSRELAQAFDAPWPSFLIGMVSIMFSSLAWWCTEAGFAWLTALWETEHAQIARDRGLPRAEIIVRK